MRQAFLLGLGALGVVSRIAIGDQGAGEVRPQQIARHFSSAGGVELKVDVLFCGVRTTRMPFLLGESVIFSGLGLILYSVHDLIPCIDSAPSIGVVVLQEERHDTSSL
jgi:hypothetical protein